MEGKARMKRFITVLIGLALIGAGWFAFNYYREGQQAAASSNYQVVRAEKGDLTATIGATGTVRANQTAIITWQTSGVVEEVRVAPGDLVEKDRILATIKKTSLPQTVILAEADLLNAQKSLRELLEPASELALAQAEQAIVQAEMAVRDAERYLTNLKSTAPQLDIEQARSNLVLSRNKLDQAKRDFEPFENRSEDDLMRATMYSNLAQAQREYDAASRKLNNLLGTANPLDLKAAEANLALAQAQLQEAEDNYERLQNGPEPEDITALEARIAAAQATLGLKTITAPFTGTITQVEVKPGDQINPGSPAFRLDDLSHLLVDVRVSEVDINRIQLDQDVFMTFDAILGYEYQGLVSELSPVGVANQGVVDFIATVELTEADGQVKPGMTSAVNIIINRLNDVLMVPNRAVRVRDGQRVVYVLRADQLEPVRINLGASSDTMSEVAGGQLKVGDQIVLNPPTTFEQGGPPQFMR
jgi:HlyD family secretion protein